MMESGHAPMDRMRIMTSAPAGSVARTGSSVRIRFSVLQAQICASRSGNHTQWFAHLQIYVEIRPHGNTETGDLRLVEEGDQTQ